MKPEIADDQTIAEVQDMFHNIFPFLKIVFFERDIHALNKMYPYKAIVRTNRLLGEFRLDKIDSGALELNKDLTVKEFEQYLDSLYCLHAQVFRRSGNVWLETTVTNSWTLEEQNRQGKLLTAQMLEAKL